MGDGCFHNSMSLLHEGSAHPLFADTIPSFRLEPESPEIAVRVRDEGGVREID